MTITPTMQADLYAWNAGINNARNDYEQHPSRACHEHPCDELRDGDATYCPEHRRAANRAAKKRRAARRAA